jgi:hypothetical protein
MHTSHRRHPPPPFLQANGLPPASLRDAAQLVAGVLQADTSVYRAVLGRGGAETSRPHSPAPAAVALQAGRLAVQLARHAADAAAAAALGSGIAANGGAKLSAASPLSSATRHQLVALALSCMRLLGPAAGCPQLSRVPLKLPGAADAGGESGSGKGDGGAGGGSQQEGALPAPAGLAWAPHPTAGPMLVVVPHPGGDGGGSESAGMLPSAQALVEWRSACMAALQAVRHYYHASVPARTSLSSALTLPVVT